MIRIIPKYFFIICISLARDAHIFMLFCTLPLPCILISRHLFYINLIYTYNITVSNSLPSTGMREKRFHILREGQLLSPYGIYLLPN